MPPTQQRLWPELECVPPQFVLYGGTAIALRLGHRQSIDFDFFSSEPFEHEQLFHSLPMLRGAKRLQSRLNTLSVEIDRGGPVELSFFGGLTLGRVAEPDRAQGNGLRVASMLDLAGMKAAVVQERALRKDYLDIAALLKSGLQLADALAAAGALYGEQFNPFITIKALSYFSDGDLPRLPDETMQFLTQAAAAVREIPVIKRRSDKIVDLP